MCIIWTISSSIENLLCNNKTFINNDHFAQSRAADYSPLIKFKNVSNIILMNSWDEQTSLNGVGGSGIMIV